MEEEDEVDSIIEEFFGNLELTESGVMHVKSEMKWHVNWLDGWKNEESIKEEDIEASEEEI